MKSFHGNFLPEKKEKEKSPFFSLRQILIPLFLHFKVKENNSTKIARHLFFLRTNFTTLINQFHVIFSLFNLYISLHIFLLNFGRFMVFFCSSCFTCMEIFFPYDPIKQEKLRETRETRVTLLYCYLYQQLYKYSMAFFYLNLFFLVNLGKQNKEIAIF